MRPKNPRKQDIASLRITKLIIRGKDNILKKSMEGVEMRLSPRKISVSKVSFFNTNDK